MRLIRTGSDLIGRTVLLPGGERAEVIDVEHEFDNGTTLRYLDGPYKGYPTMRDTSAVRRYLTQEGDSVA